MPIRKPIFIVPLDLGSMATGNAASGFPVTNLNRHKAIGLTWKSSGSTNVWARGQFTASRAIEFCAIVAANAQAGTKFRLRLGTSQAQVDGSAPYDSGALDFISPSITREDGLYHSHLEIGTVQNATWWRIDITGHSGDFQAADLVLGRMVEPSRFYNLDFEFGVEDQGEIEVGRNGVMNEQPGIIMRTAAFKLAWITEAEFEANFRPMVEKLGKRGVAYVVFDPDPSTYRQAKTFMGIMRKPPFARGVRKPQTYEMDFEILSFI